MTGEGVESLLFDRAKRNCRLGLEKVPVENIFVACCFFLFSYNHSMSHLGPATSSALDSIDLGAS
jgi:hypothetical protein